MFWHDKCRGKTDYNNDTDTTRANAANTILTGSRRHVRHTSELILQYRWKKHHEYIHKNSKKIVTGNFEDSVQKSRFPDKKSCERCHAIKV